MPTVLQINSVCATGSTGRIAIGLQGAVDRAGGAGWIAYGRGKASSIPKTIRVGGDLSLLAHVALTRILDRHGLGSRGATFALIRQLDRLAPDIIHLHNIHGYFLNFEVLFQYLKATRIPVVWTLHDCWPLTGHCSYFDYVECARWQTQCSRCPQRSKYPASWLLDASAEMFERKKQAFAGVEGMTLVTPSAWLAGEVRKSFLGTYAIEVIPNGVDASTFAPSRTSEIRARFGIPPNVNVILGVAANFGNPCKGLNHFIAMARNLPREAVLVLVGVPRARITRLPANVIGIPRTESVQDLVALYSMASVFVDPALEDNFPTVILEALACGTPVVAFATGGCPEQITRETGLLVKAGDVHALLAATESVLRLGKDSFGAACRAHAKRFSVHNMFQAYLRLYARRSSAFLP